MLIWYNPDSDCYEKGYIEEFQSQSDQSLNKDRFELIYFFHKDEYRVIDKTLKALNQVRSTRIPTPSASYF